MVVAEKLAHFARQQHGDNIAIIAIYDLYALGGATSESDLDRYAITDTKDKKKLVEYIMLVNNRPVDLWSLSWTKAQALASATYDFPEIWAVAASIFVNS